MSCNWRDLKQAENDWVLIDSGATHALRPAHDLHEWTNAERTVVQLANGETEAFRLKKGHQGVVGAPYTNDVQNRAHGWSHSTGLHTAVVW